MRRLNIAFLLLFTLLPTGSFSNYIDDRWKVIKMVGEPWYLDPGTVYGKYQTFNKGFAEGVFFSCNFAGLSKAYNKYNLNEFFTNKEFKLFRQHAFDLNIQGKAVFVHRITCNGKDVSDRKVMYPFITVEDSRRGFYLFEGAIYFLEY